MEEHFNSYVVLIDKLKTSHKIDLLNDATGVDTVLAHLTFKKFPQNVKNVLMQICETHYPTFQELIDKLPVAIERISKSECTGAEEVICSNVTAKNYKPKMLRIKNLIVHYVIKSIIIPVSVLSMQLYMLKLIV